MVKLNKNCLQGLRCPKCGSCEPLNVTISLTIPIYDDGFEFPRQEDHTIYWDDKNPCRCDECDYDGDVSDFNVKEENDIRRDELSDSVD